MPVTTSSGGGSAPKKSGGSSGGYNPFTLGGVLQPGTSLPKAKPSSSKPSSSSSKSSSSSWNPFTLGGRVPMDATGLPGTGTTLGGGLDQNTTDALRKLLSSSKSGSAPKVTNTPDNSAGGSGAGGVPTFTTPYDGMTPPNLAAVMQQAAGPQQSLQSYINQAVKGLGPGTNYGALESQVKSDTARSNTNIGNMYSALNSGIRANDPILQSIYNDSANQMKASASQTQGAINSAYNSAKAQTAQTAAATGQQVSAVDMAAAAGDQANAVSRSAQNQQSALTNNTSLEANARDSNVQTANAASFQGKQDQANLQQQLADNLAKLQVQQSTENSSRRAQALQDALQMQSSDRGYSQAQEQMAMTAAGQDFSNQMGLQQAKTGYQSGVIGAQQAATNSQNTFVTNLLKQGYMPTTDASGNETIGLSPTSALKQQQLQRENFLKILSMPAYTNNPAGAAALMKQMQIGLG